MIMSFLPHGMKFLQPIIYHEFIYHGYPSNHTVHVSTRTPLQDCLNKVLSVSVFMPDKMKAAAHQESLVLEDIHHRAIRSASLRTNSSQNQSEKIHLKESIEVSSLASILKLDLYPEEFHA